MRGINYTSTPQYVFITWYLVKRREEFTFLHFAKCSVARKVFRNKSDIKELYILGHVSILLRLVFFLEVFKGPRFWLYIKKSL
jgi:hypothetical protein